MKQLNFQIQKQVGDYLCWAAVAASVERYYGGAAWTQCRLAFAELPPGTIGTCCEPTIPSACDKPRKLQDALNRINHYASFAPGLGAMTDMVSMIDANRPVALRIGFPDSSAHFVVVAGYLEGFLTVCDPLEGSVSQVRFDVLSSDYDGGVPTHRLFTR